jgi:methyl-accepting chemotaxis protein
MLNNRRSFYINKDFQTRFILRFVAAATFWAAATVVTFVALAQRRLEDVRYSTPIGSTSASDLILPSLAQSHLITLAIFGGLLAYAVHAMWKKMSTPLAVIKRDILRIADGDLASPIAIRAGDDFPELAASLDSMRESLRAKAAAMKDCRREVDAAAEQLSKSIWKGGASADHVKRLRESVRRLKEEADAFTC